MARKLPPKRGRVGRFVHTTARRRGLLGADRRWFAVWALLTTTQFLRKRFGRTEEVVYRTELKPGERLLVAHHPPDQ